MALPGISSDIYGVCARVFPSPFRVGERTSGDTDAGPPALLDKKLGWWRVETK